MIEKAAKILKQRKDITEWIAREERRRDFQLYLAHFDTEAIRKVEDHFILVTVIRSDQRRAGWTTIRVYNDEISEFPSLLDQAVEIASLAENHPFRLPVAAGYPDIPLADDRILADMESAAFQVKEQLGETSRALPSPAKITGAEILVGKIEKRLALSNGSGHHHVETGVVFDAPLVLSKKEGEAERWLIFEGRAIDDIPPGDVLLQYAEEAVDKIDGRPPATGTRPLIIRGKELIRLFHPLIHHGSMKSKVERTSLFEEGKNPFGEMKGEPLTLSGDPLEPFGLRSTPYCALGTPSGRHELIKNGIFLDPWGTPEHAARLNIAPTGVFGNIIVEEGSRPAKSLYVGDETILEIAAFSNLVTDPQTGSFMGEIRIGYEIRGRAENRSWGAPSPATSSLSSPTPRSPRRRQKPPATTVPPPSGSKTSPWRATDRPRSRHSTPP